MNILKKLPIAFNGTLNDVRLIQFSVEKDEIADMFPGEIPTYNYGNRVLISMVNVDLQHMRPAITGKLFKFNYRHVAFRMVVDDGPYLEGNHNKGIYFLRSFSNKNAMVKGSNMLTSFQMEKAEIEDRDFMFEMKQGDHFLHYAIEKQAPASPSNALKDVIGRLDRAYSKVGNNWYERRVHRKAWPIEEVNCYHFETNFFKTAQLEGAFIIREPVEYHWSGPRQVHYFDTDTPFNQVNYV